VQPLVYIETTIFSFYHDDRTATPVVAMRQWTREWWDSRRADYTLVTSIPVLAELERGNLAHKKQALDLALQLPAIAAENAAAEIAQVYIRERIMPNNPVGDALHLALASLHKCDYLLTWNCRHLANANKFGHIRRINAMLGLYIPSLVTPLELIGSESE